MTLTGRGSPRRAQEAIKAAKDRGWESYRSIERYSAEAELCRRRQILDHFGDPEPGRPDGPLLRRVRPRPGARARRRQRRRRRRGAARAAGARRTERRRGRRRSTSASSSAAGVAHGARGGQAGVHGGGRRDARGGAAPTPARRGELIEIRGIGPAFCEKHGESLLAGAGRARGRRGVVRGAGEPCSASERSAALASVPAPT